MTWALGIDPSLKHSAFVLGEGDCRMQELRTNKRFDIKIPLEGHQHELARLASIVAYATSVFEAVEETMAPRVPRVAAFEGYSFGSLQGREALGELQGQLRLMAHQRGWSLLIVPPLTLKKFITGDGRAAKDTVMMSVLKKWSYEPSDNNNADAYGLCRVALGFAQHYFEKLDPGAELKALFKKCVLYEPAEAA